MQVVIYKTNVDVVAVQYAVELRGLVGMDVQINGTPTINTLKAMAELINNEYDIDYPFAKTQGLPNLGNARIEIIAADSQGNPEVGATEAERLITEENVTGAE